MAGNGRQCQEMHLRDVANHISECGNPEHVCACDKMVSLPMLHIPLPFCCPAGRYKLYRMPRQ